MGTDIHVWVEVKDEIGLWEPTHAEFPAPYDEDETIGHFIPSKWDADNPMRAENVRRHGQTMWMGRNYSLFGILADVRNGRGFAGIDMGDPLSVIAAPRDLPEDVSPLVRAAACEYQGHDTSWLTLEEIDDFDWEQTATLRGVVDWEAFLKWKKDGARPYEYCGSISGRSIVTMSADMAISIVDCDHTVVQLYPGAEVHVQVEWHEPYRDLCREFLQDFVPVLRTLGEPQDVRMVFWFDS